MKVITNFTKGQGVQSLSITSIASNTISSFIAEFYNRFSYENIRIDFFESNVEDIMKRVHRRESEQGFVYISNM